MAKKLKKKIEELCGLAGLQWEERRARAEKILENNDWKQELCNEIQGLTYREIEKSLQSIIAARQPKEDYDDKLRTYRETKQSVQNPGRRINSPKSGDEKRPAGRSLADILKQVYSPRCSELVTEEERGLIRSYRGIQDGDEVLSVPMYDGDSAGE